MTTRGTDQGGRTATWHAWPALAAAGGLFLLPLLLFVTLAEDVAEHEVFAFDRPVMMWLHGNASPGLTALMEGLTQLGGLVVVPVVATIAAVVLWRRGLRRGATVLAAAALAQSSEPGDTAASRKRAVKAAVEEVAGYLGNTPTIAKNSYIDPRVLDRYESGTTIAMPGSRSPQRRQAALEKAVLELLQS